MKTRRLLLLAVVVPVAFGGILLAGMALLGSRLPRAHTATVRVTLPVPAETAWARVSDIDRWPSWNRELAIRRLPDSAEGRPVYAWVHHGDEIASEVIESADLRLVTRIADPSLPFGGTWTWEVSPAAATTSGGCTVTITEDGHIDNTVFRFLAHHAFGYTGSMEQMLRALSEDLGGSPPVVVASGK